MKLITSILLILCTSLVRADYYDGNSLLELAEHEDIEANLMYRGYTAGVQDAYNGKHFCVPSKVRLDQSAEVVLKYIKNEPKIWHEPGKNLVIWALKDAFPCEPR